MSEFFKSIPKIAYEGKNSKNPLAFKFYNPDEVIAGKTMREQLKFALSWWHTMGGDGTDMFGCGTTDKTWGCDDVTARAKAKVEAAFEIMEAEHRLLLFPRQRPVSGIRQSERDQRKAESNR